MIDETTLVLRHIADLAKKRDRCGYTLFSKFLSLPHQQITGINNFALWGGFESAERKIAAFYPDWQSPEDIDWPISFIKIYLTDKKTRTHRDFLGSLLGLGIKRELIGDIIITEDTAFVATTPEIAPYICDNLISVSHSRVQCEIVNIDDIEIPEKQFKTMRTTLASMRIDCVTAYLAGKSRAVAAQMIASGRVQVNYKEISSVSHVICPRDIISVRGEGKFVFDGEDGVSKKGRIIAMFRKYI